MQIGGQGGGSWNPPQWKHICTPSTGISLEIYTEVWLESHGIDKPIGAGGQNLCQCRKLVRAGVLYWFILKIHIISYSVCSTWLTFRLLLKHWWVKWTEEPASMITMTVGAIKVWRLMLWAGKKLNENKARDWEFHFSHRSSGTASSHQGYSIIRLPCYQPTSGHSRGHLCSFDPEPEAMKSCQKKKKTLHNTMTPTVTLTTSDIQVSSWK